MLAPQLEAEPEDPLLELGLAAREHYGPLADALRETTGIDIGLWREGHRLGCGATKPKRESFGRRSPGSGSRGTSPTGSMPRR